MIVLHPRIYTRAAHGVLTDALLVRDGRVVATGDDARAAQTPADRVLTPEGACVFPALADAHIHLWGLGMRPDTLDLGAARSPDDVYAAVRDEAARRPEGWIIGFGWDENLWEGGGRLEAAALEEAVPGRLVSLKRVDHHALFASPAALVAAGIFPASPGAPHEGGASGHVARDADGQPTGLLVDDAMRPVRDAIPPVTEADDERLLFDHAARLRGLGIASAHMAYASVASVGMLDRLIAEGRLPMRISVMIDAHDPHLDALLEAGPRLDPDARCSVASIKFFADGAMGSRGALMLEDYVGGGRGLAVVGAEELAARVPELAAAGWQVATHAIGDAAARAVLDAYSLCAPTDRAATRPRVEHAQIMTSEDVARLGALGILASIQPIHMRSDAPWAAQALHPHQLERLFSFADLGAVAALSGGSDYPIDDPNPWRGIHAAVTRLGADGRVFRADQALTRAQALHAYTLGAAHAARWEDRLGALEPGFEADLIALSHDPLECPDDDLPAIEVLGSWFAFDPPELA